MVHDEADALLVSVAVQRRQVEVGIGGEEVEDVVLVLAVPVFPADVPALDEEGVEAVLGGKVDIAAHIGVVGSVTAVGLGFAVVGDGTLQRWRQRGVARQAHRGEVVGVAPGAVVADHLPPHAHILHGVYPADVLQNTRFVEVEDEARAEHVGGLFADLDGAPGADTGSLQTAHIACGVGREVHLQRKSGVVEVKVHRRVVKHGGLVDVDIKAVVGLHLQGCLEAGLRETLPGPAAAFLRLPIEAAHLREATLGVVELLRVVVAGDPPHRVVAREAELRQLVGEPEVDQRVVYPRFRVFQFGRYIIRPLIAEAETVVVQAETYIHHRGLVHTFAFVVEVVVLLQADYHLVVVVADVGFLAPHGLPGLVERFFMHIVHLKSASHIVLAPF